MKNIYLLGYSSGNYDDFYQNIIFSTDDKNKAEKYVEKFNRLLEKWKNYYSNFEEDDFGFIWLKEEYINKHFKNWNKIKNINECYCQKIELR